MASDEFHTYHCLCSELVFASLIPLSTQPQRKSDSSRICRLSQPDPPTSPKGVSFSSSAVNSTKPFILKLDDGFDKRYTVSCARCELPIGYYLDSCQFDQGSSGMKSDVFYVLPGSVMTTEEMKTGKDMSGEIGLDGTRGG